MDPTHRSSSRSLKLSTLFFRYRAWVIGTWLLVIAEAALALMFPLFIGIAIDGLLNEKLYGLYWLGAIGVATVFTGAARRFYDTRIYSKIYAKVSAEIVAQEHDRHSDVSAITARTNMATEFVEFLENSFPEIINSAIALIGTLVMIYFLQLKSFFACLVATAVIVLIYAATSWRTFRLNKGANDEFERRVDVVKNNDPKEISSHFQKVIRWNIRLSDLETFTFSASWIVMIVVLLFSVWATVQDGVTSQGKVLAILMYVFGYIESVIVMPLFYQQIVRLREIAIRLNG